MGINLIISDQGVFHRRCWMIQESQEAVRRSKKHLKRSSAKLERSKTTLRRLTSEDTRICPVCVQPINAMDIVSGIGDDLLHQQCDYLVRSKLTIPPKSRG